jgi:hypothetical protein
MIDPKHVFQKGAPMPAASPNRETPIDVTSGEILIGTIWLAVYGLLILMSLS